MSTIPSIFANRLFNHFVDNAMTINLLPNHLIERPQIGDTERAAKKPATPAGL
jgi:hypothetical protein